MPNVSPSLKGLFHFRPPYERYEPVTLDWQPQPPPEPGGSLVWMMASEKSINSELNQVRSRPRGLPLIVILPRPTEILPMAGIIREIPDLRPKAVIPSTGRGLAASLQVLLAAAPPALPVAVSDYLEDAKMIPDHETRDVVQTIFRLAPQVTNIESLAARMCQSRRTLGRYFQTRRLPVPSHWLQFARILHVAIQIQNARVSVNRISARFGYSDGFTMSNSMKRLTGYRPSFVRTHLGWEWIVEAWIRKEK